MTRPAETGRYFFALWPDPELAGQIHQVVSQPLAGHDGKRVAMEKYHLTLAYYGPADDTTRVCLEKAAESVSGQAFEITLNTLGYWPRPRVIWLAPAGGDLPEALRRLQADLSGVLAERCAYRPENRPYAPHLTLTRKSHCGPRHEPINPIVWPVRHFVLVRSVTRPSGAEYQLLKQWPLAD